MRSRPSALAVVLTGAWLAALAGPPARGAAPAADSNPYLWLSEIHDRRALAWVEAQNGRSDLALKTDPSYARDRSQILDVLNADTRIPEGMLDHGWVLNFWQGADHVRGIWRRTTIVDYARQAPHWRTLLDLDRLDRQMHENWVWKGADCTSAFDRCLVRLSPGGGDAAEIREYDPRSRRFVAGGFKLPAAKSAAVYLRPDAVLVATDFGPGSITPSSYPRIVKLWRRGEPLSSARTVFEGRPHDMAAMPAVFHGPYGTVALIIRRPSFFRADYYVLRSDGTTLKLPLPDDAQVTGVTRGELIATLQSAWTVSGRTIGQGALIAFPVLDFARSGRAQPVSVLYTPGAHSMIDEVAAGRDAVFASVYRNVTGSIHEFRPRAHGQWSDTRLMLPRGGSTSIVSTNDWGPQAYFSFQSFLTPPSLFAYGGQGSPKLIKAQPATFDARGIAVRQYWAVSRDGTRVPYFLVRPKKARGPIPTILYGYGGFQLSLTPWYWNDGHRPLDAGETWLTRGGAIAVANIRGGGEFGPAWHQAALKYHRQRAYDDFEAVAADIERRGLSTPKRLGIVGASNGGLLVSTVMVQRPDLFGAVVCQRPLIDMLRYTRFGAGASWIGEYGDPADPRMAAYIRTYSPYQNVRRGVDYPPILFITETTDDRVTPVFARMMAAKMEAQGHDVLFNEAAEGGHGPGATHAEEAQYWALSYAFLAKRLGLGH
ncbi:MAG TPA: prolyl oligopeptidase family serine peptidase [Steroidobacteraceae bacterium]|nr:prolyl oligopeptidase family serine peptidase [Steroidobacteraceae bacterium]